MYREEVKTGARGGLYRPILSLSKMSVAAVQKSGRSAARGSCHRKYRSAADPLREKPGDSKRICRGIRRAKRRRRIFFCRT